MEFTVTHRTNSFTAGESAPTVYPLSGERTDRLSLLVCSCGQIALQLADPESARVKLDNSVQPPVLRLEKAKFIITMVGTAGGDSMGQKDCQESINATGIYSGPGSVLRVSPLLSHVCAS